MIVKAVDESYKIHIGFAIIPAIGETVLSYGPEKVDLGVGRAEV